MNKIELLLHTLAPKGVEFKKIGELFKRNKGINITAAQMKELHSEIGKVRIFAGGATKADINYKDISKKDIINCESVIIKSRGNIGFEYYNQPFSHKNEIWSYSSKTNQMLVKFLYYYLSNNQYYFQKLAQSSSVKLPQLSVSDTDEYEVPVPPLEIQQEIVKILDAFTELNTELNARKKQYEYYQNMLLDFNDINQSHKDAKERLAQKPYPKRLKALLHTLAPKGVGFRKLGEVINILKGKQLNKELLLDYGEYPVMNGGIYASGYWNEYNTDYPKIIISQGGASAGYVNYMTSKFWAGAHCYTIELNSEKLNYKFLYYFFKNSQTILMKSQFGAGIPALNKADIETLTIPIPPLEIQQEIVTILDQFSILTTDLLAGIPAEIKARKKQYEYYREKLLAFKPLTPNKEVKKG
ncbi:restriction endonuclease subunit S [Helicobacter pylori]|uniref:restriction endonuclease subunit S n=1 Tax=Helicobacter pylori TaxID=210 RepID=UPI00026AFAB9|nr:restriction endonuclease subunit S [Helicobacter pylori]EJB96607.1 type I restriction modification DNA specificity domain protein [Helicobacter pylori Hp P-1]EJC20357.1 type I restriction modification DNA specificity domain protein [Helicobacter pylori Hp P-1b]